MAKTWRVAYLEDSRNWAVYKSGRRSTTKGTKQAEINNARARASQGDTLKVERRNGSTQKEVTITSTNEDRLDMNQGEFSIF